MLSQTISEIAQLRHWRQIWVWVFVATVLPAWGLPVGDLLESGGHVPWDVKNGLALMVLVVAVVAVGGVVWTTLRVAIVKLRLR